MRILSTVLLTMLLAASSRGQDSTRIAPKWALDLYLGGGSSEKVTARTGPDAKGTIDLAGWFHLGAGVERRIAGRWRVPAHFTCTISPGAGGVCAHMGAAPPTGNVLSRIA